jgi:serine/threonine protein kinase
VSKDAGENPTGPPAMLPIDPGDRAPIGLRIQGRYRIAGEIGTGSFGIVCLAEDEATGHPVAIRLLPQVLVGAPLAAQPVQRAGLSIVAASTAHPGLARVLEFGEVEHGRPFVAMELVGGRPLSEILSEGSPLDVGTALRLALDLGGAVETLHNMGLVHGALRPSNVMVFEDGRVKLMDLELIGLRDASATQSVLAAEPPAEYLSPEQVRRAPLTEGTDIYAFAVILYEMLCGAPPLLAATREAVLAKHLAETPEPMRRRRRAIPVPVESIVALALSKEPEQRPPMQTILNLLWEVANSPPTRWKRTAAIVSGAALAASIAGLGTWSLLAPRPSAPPPLAQPAPPPAARQAPVSPPPTSSARAVETPAAPAVRAATPAVGPAAAARKTPPSALPSAAPPAKAERREELRAPQGPTSAARERPASSNDAEGDDAGAVIDWLLNRSSARGQ